MGFGLQRAQDMLRFALEAVRGRVGLRVGVLLRLRVLARVRVA